MAKFKNSHLKLKTDQRTYYGDSDQAWFSYTTVSGRGTNLTTNVPISGEKALEWHQLVRKDQLDALEHSIASGDWQDSVLTITGTNPSSPSDGDRYLVDSPAGGSWTGKEDYIVEWSTASGTWLDYPPNEGFATWVEDVNKLYIYYDNAWHSYGEGISHSDLQNLDSDDHIQYVLVDGTRGFTGTVSGIDPTQSYHLTTKNYVDTQISTVSGVTDHGDLTGLLDDDHPQYILVNGTRGFTGTVSGIDPTESQHLTTKHYVDDAISTISGSIITDHGELSGLGDDDHPQYILVDGTRGFTGTVSGIDPTESYHLTTKQYVDDEISTVSGSIITDHGQLSGLGDDDHPQYILVDGTRGFTATVSGVDPIADSDLATKHYVDEQFATISGARKWGRMSVINGATSQAVTFSNSFSDDQYTLVATLTNEVDSPPSIYSTIQGVKTAGGFTTHFSGEIDSSNFVLEWIAEYGQQS